MLVVYGDFDEAGGAPADRLAVWDGEEWTELEESPILYAYAIEAGHDGLYAVGTTIYMTTVLAFWDGEEWEVRGSLEYRRASLYITDLAVFGDAVAVGGRYDQAGSIQVGYVALWKEGDWTDLGRGTDNQVNSVAAVGGRLFAGGILIRAGTARLSGNIAPWDGNEWSAVRNPSQGRGLNDGVFAVVSDGNHFCAGGAFTDTGDQSLNRIAKWDGENWHLLGEGFNGSVNSLLFMDGELHAGGSFTY